MILSPLKIGDRTVGTGHPVYLVAEMSANHLGDYDRAARIIEAAADSGADAIKLQTYTADTLTIDCDGDPFRIKGTIWDGRSLHELYCEAYTPWEWQPKLKQVAEDLGLDLFSTPFDATAVDFLEEMGVPCHKIASFELVDVPLLRKVAATGKPVIASTGMATLGEIEEAVRALRNGGTEQIALLKCTSAYPARPDEMHLRTMPHLSEAFHVQVGLSDHSLGMAAAVTAVALGACIIEKHFTISRSDPGPDSTFSMEPSEFKAMADAIRTSQQALGEVHYGITDKEAESRTFRRSLFVVENMAAGEKFTPENLRSIRPAHGLHPRFLDSVIGRKARVDIRRGTPLAWNLIQ